MLSALPASRAAIVVTEAMTNSSHPDIGPSTSGNGDWFELFNNGPTAVDLSGWSWDDNHGVPGAGSFGSITLNPGKYLIVVNEPAANRLTWISSVWNVLNLVNSGDLIVLDDSAWANNLATDGNDQVNIYNSGGILVTSVTIPASAAANDGRSYAWDQFGGALGFSVNGIAGAHKASGDGAGGAGTDIASPGVAAVPEPKTWLMVSAGLMLGMWMMRRKRLNP